VHIAYWVNVLQVVLSDCNLSVLFAVVYVHGIAWMMSFSMREILSFRPKLAIRHRLSIPLALLPAVVVPAIRMRRWQQVAAIHGTHQWTTQHQQQQANPSVCRCRWSTHVSLNRTIQLHQQCATVNHHYLLVCYITAVYRHHSLTNCVICCRIFEKTLQNSAGHGIISMLGNLAKFADFNLRKTSLTLAHALLTNITCHKLRIEL